jgi:hypothetical protein
VYHKTYFLWTEFCVVNEIQLNRFYFTFISILLLQRPVAGCYWIMNSEGLQFCSLSLLHPWIFSEKRQETPITIAGLWSEIRRQVLPNRKKEFQLHSINISSVLIYLFVSSMYLKIWNFDWKKCGPGTGNSIKMKFATLGKLHKPFLYTL